MKIHGYDITSIFVNEVITFKIKSPDNFFGSTIYINYKSDTGNCKVGFLCGLGSGYNSFLYEIKKENKNIQNKLKEEFISQVFSHINKPVLSTFTIYPEFIKDLKKFVYVYNVNKLPIGYNAGFQWNIVMMNPNNKNINVRKRTKPKKKLKNE